MPMGTRRDSDDDDDIVKVLCRLVSAVEGVAREVHHHGGQRIDAATLARIEWKLDQVLAKEVAQMSLSQELLDAVTSQTTVVSSFITLVEGLVANGTVTPEAAAAIKAELSRSQAQVETAIIANTPVAP